MTEARLDPRFGNALHNLDPLVTKSQKQLGVVIAAFQKCEELFPKDSQQAAYLRDSIKTLESYYLPDYLLARSRNDAMDFKHMAQILDLAMDSAKGLHRSLEKLNYKNPKLVAPARVVEMLQYPTNMLLVTLESEMMGKANAEHAKAIKDYIGFLQNRSARR